jgi:hypothetical protein
MPTSTQFALFCLELAEYDLSTPLLVILDRYNRMQKDQPQHAGFANGKLPEFREFLYMLRIAPEKELSDMQMLSNSIGQLMVPILSHRFAWMRDPEFKWIDDGLPRKSEETLRGIIQSEDSKDPTKLKEIISRLDLR